MIRLPKILSRIGLGKLVYNLFYRPVGALKRSIREGGPIEQHYDKVGHEAMRSAAMVMPALDMPPQGPNAEICFLSGPKFWHQTVFCFASLQSFVPYRITPIIYDDGRLDAKTRDKILRVVPWARFMLADETEAKLDRLLPEAKFPTLRERRRNYPHLRKLIDIHIDSESFRIVADSDMLFFRTPDQILSWFDDPYAFFMQDTDTAYGYPQTFLRKLAGELMPEKVNVGLYAIDGKIIDWEKIEYWCKLQNETYGPCYLQEQALTAMLFAGVNATPLPSKDYVVMPSKMVGVGNTPVLNHYVDISKRFYFRQDWKVLLSRQTALHNRDQGEPYNG